MPSPDIVKIDPRTRCLQDVMLQEEEMGLYIYQLRLINYTVYSELTEDVFVMPFQLLPRH
jgi:hypothetical protein